MPFDDEPASTISVTFSVSTNAENSITSISLTPKRGRGEGAVHCIENFMLIGSAVIGNEQIIAIVIATILFIKKHPPY